MRHTPFYRVSDCHNASGGITSVCIRTQDRLQDLLRVAYDDLAVVNRTVRAASRELAVTPSRAAEALASGGGSWSRAVVDRAFFKLAGAYQPARAAAIDAERKAAENLAVENNAQWDAAA